MNGEEITNATVKRSGLLSDQSFIGMTFVAGMFIFQGAMIYSAYKLGVNVANKMMKRHDKDVRVLEKKTRKQLKKLKRTEP